MRVVLLCHVVTEGLKPARFGDTLPTPTGLADTRTVVAPRADRVLSGPSEACRQTAVHLGLAAAVDDRLAGCDYGGWHGHTLDEVGSSDPDGLAEWLVDPEAAPHGGESLAAVQRRVGQWLDEQASLGHRAAAGASGARDGDAAGRAAVRSVLAIADAAVIRAAVAYAIEAGPRSLWRIDMAPLCRAVLVGEPGRWALRELGR